MNLKIPKKKIKAKPLRGLNAPIKEKAYIFLERGFSSYGFGHLRAIFKLTGEKYMV